MQYYTVKVTDRLLRFDTAGDSWTVTLLPFAQTPNAPYEVQKTSQGDGHTVTVQTDLVNGPNDFLLADGSTAITLDDTTHTVYIRIPANGASPAYVNSGGVGGGQSVSIPPRCCLATTARSRSMCRGRPTPARTLPTSWA
jgi:hypothetical protein